MSIQIKLWGVRGSCPTPIKTEEYLSKTEEVLEFLLPVARKNPQQSAKELLSLLPAKYKALVGGNTTCIEITEDNLRLIIDLGTGARELGYTILGEKKEKQTKELHILMTHTHWDHIQGWPFFYTSLFTRLYHPFLFFHCRLKGAFGRSTKSKILSSEIGSDAK